jgi:hypothetical protein
VLLGETADLEVQVRAVEAAHEHRRVLHPQPLDDLAPDRGRGGCGQGQQGRVPEALGEGAKAQVVGTEVVAPLAHAVGLVDHQQGRLRLPQLLQNLLFGQLLRGQQDELALALAQRLHQLLALALGDRRVQLRRLARRRLLHRLDLVALQGDQRRDDDRRAVEQLPGQLVDRRLAVAGRHHRQGVAAGGHRLDRLQLAGPQLLDPERLPCQPLDLLRRGFGRRHGAIPTRPRGRASLNVPSQARRGGGTRRCRLKRGAMIEVSRTLMKSEPELAELVETVSGLEVTMAEKGFGTRVQLRASEESGLAEADLEAVLDRLAEPQRRPFS